MTTSTLPDADAILQRLVEAATIFEFPIRPRGYVIALRGNDGIWGICRTDSHEFQWWTATGWTAKRDLADPDRAHQWPAAEAPTLALRLADELTTQAGEGE